MDEKESNSEKKVGRNGENNITSGIRENPWIVSSVVLGILAVILIVGSFSGFSVTGNAISSTNAADILISALEAQGATGISAEYIKEVSGVYEIGINYQGQILPFYITKDGKLIGQLSPISGNSDYSTEDYGSSNEVVDLETFTSNSSLYPSIGPDNAENVVIEFSDFQCPYCTMASGLASWTSSYESQYGDLIGVGQKIKEKAEAGELKFVYVSMSFLGEESVFAAQAGLCANEQGKFWEMHDVIFKASDSPSEHTGKYSKENLKILAKTIIGLDKTKFNSCLDTDKTSSDVQKISAQASTVATGTPTFYVNGQQVSASWTAIQAALK